MLVLAPLLPAVARDLDVSVAAAGQLRAIAGLVAGCVAAALGLVSARYGLRRLLATGLWLTGIACALSAVAPSFALLAAAQALVGVGIALTYAAAVAGSAEWSPTDDRSSALATALLGPPLAWSIALPLVGLAGRSDWRVAWVVPLGLSVLALVLTRGLDVLPPAPATRGPFEAFRIPGARRWALGELFVFSAMTGALVYAGAYLQETYGLSVTETGLVLGLAAASYLPGSLIFRRVVDVQQRMLLVGMPIVAAVVVGALFVIQSALWLSVTLFSLITFIASGRSLAGSSAGLEFHPTLRLPLMGVRTAGMQFGYLLGAGVGGAALAIGGYGLAGAVFAVFYLAAAACHLGRAADRRLP